MAFLAPAGEIVDCFLPTNRETGRPRGFGFVTFSSPEEAAACIEQFNGKDMDGRRLNINPAEERRKPSGGGGDRGDRRGPPRKRRDEKGPIHSFKRGGRREGGGGDGRPGRDDRPPRREGRGGFRDDGPPRRDFSESSDVDDGPVFDTSDRQYKDEVEYDEWGKPVSGLDKKKKRKGSRRNLRQKKYDF